MVKGFFEKLNDYKVEKPKQKELKRKRKEVRSNGIYFQDSNL